LPCVAIFPAYSTLTRSGEGGERIVAVQQTSDPFDVGRIFLDIGLPGKNGYEVAQELRRQPVFAHTLLVALTGYGSAEDRRKSQESGFDIHLVKPVTAKVLRQVIMEHAQS
jgi:CheY-like chemotaxis protein